AGGEIHETLDTGAQRGPDHRVGPQKVHFHCADAALHDGVDAGNRGAVDHDLAAGQRLFRRLDVQHVSLHEMEMRVLFEMSELDRIAMEVVVDDDLIRV